MKIKIVNKTYINNTLSLSKDLMSQIYSSVFRISRQYGITQIDTIELDIQQAFKNFGKINAKAHVNNKELPWIEVYLNYKNKKHPHRGLFEKFMDNNRAKYNIYELHKQGRVSFDNTKVIDNVKEVFETIKLKRNTKQIVKTLRREYETYLELKNKFE